MVERVLLFRRPGQRPCTPRGSNAPDQVDQIPDPASRVFSEDKALNNKDTMNIKH